jgi:hypothetical protein
MQVCEFDPERWLSSTSLSHFSLLLLSPTSLSYFSLLLLSSTSLSYFSLLQEHIRIERYRRTLGSRDIGTHPDFRNIGTHQDREILALIRISEISALIRIEIEEGSQETTIHSGAACYCCRSSTICNVGQLRLDQTDPAAASSL